MLCGPWIASQTIELKIHKMLLINVSKPVYICVINQYSLLSRLDINTFHYNYKLRKSLIPKNYSDPATFSLGLVLGTKTECMLGRTPP